MTCDASCCTFLTEIYLPYILEAHINYIGACGEEKADKSSKHTGFVLMYVCTV